MDEPIANKNRPPEQDAAAMQSQVFEAFRLPYPRKPLSPPAKGRSAPAFKTSRGPRRTHGKKKHGMWQ